MTHMFKKNILYTVLAVFVIIAVVRAVLAYNDVLSRAYDFAKNEATVLGDFMMIHRDYYQSLYINKTIPLDEKTLKGLPAYSSSTISRQFTKKNIFKIEVKTVSDRARNRKNSADMDEFEAIRYFGANPMDREYFKERETYYQYAKVLKVEKKCLKCHGRREEAPLFIRKKYDMAYDYRVGEVRGIVSIKIPKASLYDYFFHQFVYSVLYALGLLVLMFIFIRYLLKRSEKINDELEAKVFEKTGELSSKNAILQSYVKALDQTSIIFKIDIDGIITDVNDAFIKVCGYSKDELIGQKYTFILHPDMPVSDVERLQETIFSKKIFKGKLLWLSKDKRKLTLDASVVPVLDRHGKIMEFIASQTDITELKQKRAELKKSLVIDSLTGLPNRYQLLHTIELCRNEGDLALLNIDNFNEINDFYGYGVGDKLLIGVASILKSMCGENIEVFKLPSDEFALYSIGSIAPEIFQANVSKIIEDIGHKAFEIDSYAIHITISCGVVSGYNELLIKADMALKKAKREKKYMVVYDRDVDTSIEIAKNLEGINTLKKAIDNDKILPLFQPIYNLSSNSVEKYECLARIEDEHGYLLSPAVFLQVAKRTKLYSHISRSMIRKSFEFFRESRYDFSINLSIQDILDRNTVEFIKSELEAFEDSKRVIFEITENEEIRNYDTIKAFINTVKAYGVKIAIDDFGSGYANFGHLLELEADYIKIDASLIKKINDRYSRVLIEGIVDFSKRLNMMTIAEHVETKETVDILRKIGVDCIQGYYIGKPSVKLL